MKLAVVGSREGFKQDEIERTLNGIDYGIFTITEIVSGGAPGVDSYAKSFAKLVEMPYKEFKAEWNLHGNGAGFIRNKQMIDYSDGVIAFWNGQSKGTKFSIDYAMKKNKLLAVFYKIGDGTQ